MAIHDQDPPPVLATPTTSATSTTGFTGATSTTGVVHRGNWTRPMPYGYIARYPTSVHDRGRALETLAKQRDYRALVDATGARYVLAPTRPRHPRGSGSLAAQGLVLLASDERFELYVDRTDPLARARSSAPR